MIERLSIHLKRRFALKKSLQKAFWF